ncbi:MAG: flippase-like domain-containing protein [Gammaproteobacteria bacterium]|nr:flippase-like domain-containing protein [Gammaproteobacteria bacterium]
MSDKAGQRGWLFVLKLLVTGTLLAVIIWQADWASIGKGLLAAELPLVLVVEACMVLCVTISAWKWDRLLRIHEVHWRFSFLHRIYFIAMFFNNFLPTSIGGDGYRIYRTLDNSRSRTCAVIAVFMERLSGIVTLLLLAWLAAALSLHGASEGAGDRLMRFYFFAGLVGIGAGLPLLYVLFRRESLRWLGSRNWLPRIAHQVLEHVEDYRQHPGLGLQVVLISVGFHLFTFFWFWLLIVAVGGELGPRELAVVLALMGVVAVLPISIAGWGVMEGSFIWLAGQFGLGFDTALTVVLLQRALLIPISIAGAVLYFSDRRERSIREIRVETGG